MFVTEMAVMGLLPVLLPLDRSTWIVHLTDATLLVMFSAPAIWWIILRPVRGAALMHEAKYAAIVDSAADGIITLDERGIVESLNPAAERIFGYGVDQIVGRNVNLLMPASEGEEQGSCLPAFLEGRRQNAPCICGEVIGRRKDGSTVPAELHVSEVRLGRRRVFTVIVREITARKAAEQALREQFHTAALGAEVGVALTRGDSLGTMLQCCAEAMVGHLGAAFARIWTLQEDENILRLQASAGLYTHIDGPHGRVPVGALKIGLIAERREPHLTNDVLRDPRISDRDWARREGMVAFAGHPLVVGERLVGVMALFARQPLSDMVLTALGSVADEIALGIERKRAEEKLRLQGTALESAANAIVITDRRGQACWVNPAFAALTGYSLQEVCGQNLRLLKSGRHDQAFYGDMWNTILAGEVWHGELINRRKDGTLFTEEMTITPVRDEKNEITHFVAIKQDITERKRAEEERIRLIRIEQERNGLQEAVRSLERVLGVVGHELRTPLAGIRATAEYLLTEDARESGEWDLFIRGINDEIIRMTGMVNDLLEVARLNSGTVRWNWSQWTLMGVCDEALDAIRPLVDHSRVRLSVTVDPPDLTMNGDAAAVRRLLVNLLNNAYKSTPEGEIHLRAASQPRDDGVCVQLQVGDTGEGMPAEVAERLGVAFALNSGVVGESYVRGSGLGLAICRGIVAAHGGRISVQTAPGKGTTVTVLLRADLIEPWPVDEAANIVCTVTP